MTVFFPLLCALLLCLSFPLFSEETAVPHSLPRGFFSFFNPVYWQAHADGLAYVVESNSDTELTSPSTAENLHFEWDWGFQVGIGYRIPHDKWSFSLGLKHLHTNAHGHKRATEGNILFPLWKTPSVLDLGVTSEADGHWRLHLGLLDYGMEREWRPAERWLFAPILGLRSGWIRQKYQLFYLRDFPFLEQQQLSMKNKFWGMGPTCGMRSAYEIFPHVHLFGRILFSLLYGEFYIHQAEWSLPYGIKILGIHETFRSSVATADMTLGLRWEFSEKGPIKKWAIECAWDHIFLYGQTQFIRFVDPHAQGVFVSKQGDLSLQGYHLGARLDF